MKIIPNELSVQPGSKSSKSMCPWCNVHTHSRVIVFFYDEYTNTRLFEICQCTNCSRPIILDIMGRNTIPYGCEFKDIPGISENDIKKMYKEIRDSYSVGAYTCSVIGCRTLLAHIAVEVGAEPNKSFQYYVKYIEENCLAPFIKKDWLDDVRSIGNECVHELVMADKDLAYDMIRLSEILLNSMYNIPDVKIYEKSIC